MNPETYDIFKGHSHNEDAQWILTVKGLYSARERMQQIAAEQPGPYFVFSASTRTVVAKTNGEDALKKIKSSRPIWQEQDSLDDLPES